MDLQPILQGMHADVSLPITRLQDVPESFEEIEFISLRFKHRLRPGVFVEFLNEQLKISENVISVVIPDTDTLRLAKGEYDLDLLYKKTNVNRPGGYEPYRLVTPAFQIVSESDKLTGVVNTEINIQTITIAGQILISRDGTNGASAFDIWKHYYGNETSTIEEYFAWVRQPANDAAASFDLLVNDFNVFNAAAVSEEQSRQTNESFRNTNEDARIVEEQLRKTKDLDRDLKEDERQLAEAERETLFDQMVDESTQATSAANAAAAASTAAANAQNTYNVTVAIPLSAGSYYNKTTARAAVPTVSRKLGLVITYATADKIWYSEKYIGTTVAGWATEENWEYVPTAANMATKTDKTELDQLRSDIAYMYPSVPTSKRVLADGGTIKSRSTLNDLTNKFLDLLPNTKLLFCPHLAVKLRESGIYKYVTKLYDIGTGMIDGAQTTALNQPFLSGNIAPNEKYAIKNPNGGSAYITHTPISFLSTDKWSVSTIINDYYSNLLRSYYIGGNVGPFISLRNSPLDFKLIVYLSGVLNFNATTVKFHGKNTIITLTYNAGKLSAFINGVFVESKDIVSNATFMNLFYSSLSLQGKISYHCIRDIALTQQQVADEYNYLRILFPEIESVQIGTQTWATSNCEMTCTPQGNVIPEMQSATNVEKITNAADREFSSDTGFWNKNNGSSINNGVLRNDPTQLSSGIIKANFITIDKWYKVTISVTVLEGGNVNVYAGIGATKTINTTGTSTFYLKGSGDTQFRVYGSVLGKSYEVDNISVEEVGWADSINLYNYIYANTSGTAEQKEYAAVNAAAMWRNVNNDPVLASVYGKKFNKYAKRLLAMDIAYYNAANPTALWGWDIPTQAQLTTLAANGGNALKAGGTNYWNTANGFNSTGLTLLGGGYIDASGNYVGNKTHEGVWCKDADIARVALDADNSFNEVAATTEGYSIRLIKV